MLYYKGEQRLYYNGDQQNLNNPSGCYYFNTSLSAPLINSFLRIYYLHVDSSINGGGTETSKMQRSINGAVRCLKFSFELNTGFSKSIKFLHKMPHANDQPHFFISLLQPGQALKSTPFALSNGMRVIEDLFQTFLDQNVPIHRLLSRRSKPAGFLYVCLLLSRKSQGTGVLLCSIKDILWFI